MTNTDWQPSQPTSTTSFKSYSKGRLNKALNVDYNIKMMDDDDWQEMPVVRDGNGASSSSDEGGSSYNSTFRKNKNAYSARKAYSHGRSNSGYTNFVGQTQPGQLSGATNATGRHLDIDDARGYSWRAKPENLGDAGGFEASKKEDKKKKAERRKRRKQKGEEVSSSSSSDSDDEEDEGGARGYTQLRLDDDVEAEDLNSATDYLFTGASGSNPMDDIDGKGATPHSQLNTTKNLLTEGQKIAYVGLVSLAAKQIIRQLERVPGKEQKNAIASADEWRLRVMARIYQHMDIEVGEQKMIESLAEHGVLIADLAPSLITTQTVDNPDFDPVALQEREEEEERAKEAKIQEEEEERTQLGESEKEIAPESRDSLSIEGDTSDPPPPYQKMGQEGKVRTYSDDENDGDLGGSRSPFGSEDGGDLGAFPPSDEEEGDGDLGVMPSEPPSRSKTSIDKKSLVSKKKVDFAEEEDDGDITAQVQPKIKTTDEVAKEGSDREDDAATIIVDPNTAKRLDTMDETLADAKATPMGLTSQPQTIDTLPSALEGVTTELSSADKTITLDLRWTVLCDLFLVLTADSVYDARSRVLLERVAEELGLTWMDVTKFEKRVTDALEIEESVSGSLKGKKAVRKRAEMARKRRMIMMGLATVGGGLVIGLSAGLMAPLIGAGLGAALGTVGIGGTTGFLTGIGGATIITSTGTIGGAALGGTGMNRRTRTVRTFEFKPIHNNKRVNCIIAVPGFMSGPQDDPRLPFSVVDSIMGDIFSLLWEPDMMQEMGNAIYLLWSETLVQGVQQVLAATIAGGLVGALAWPLWLTKLGYFIDNPWSNALDRAHSCGLILADVLSKRKMGVRPITLVGFSLGARVVFYALVELARKKNFGIVQNVYLIGTPVTANDKTWKEARSVVAGRFVNAYSRTDWILGWLFRATTGGLGSIAGLRPVERVPEVENVDVTQTVPGHLQYRAFMPLVLDQLGFRTTAEYFDEPEDLNRIPEREVVYDEPKTKSVKTSTGGFGRIFRRKDGASDSSTGDQTPDSPSSRRPSAYQVEDDDDDLPPREEAVHASSTDDPEHHPPREDSSVGDETERILAELRENGIVVRELESSLPPLVAKTTPTVPPRRGSKLRESIIADQSIEPEPEAEVPDYKEGTPTEEKIPEVVVSDQSVDSSDNHPQDRSSAKSYARPFGSTTFDANGLPPSAPTGNTSADVSLSFGDSYDVEDEGYSHPSGTAAEQDTIESSRRSSDYGSSGQQYGLSAQAARELAMQFQSAGMSNAGALAAARIAQNFEAMDDSSVADIRRPSLPSSTYSSTGSSTSGAYLGLGSGAQALEGGSASNNAGGSSHDLDPWGNLSPSPNDLTPQSANTSRARAPSDFNSKMPGSEALAPPPSARAWNNDNPWG
ncbi:DUF726-domain-containing protein [Meira miltonrushii]|uniref:DUF726-domain-containing protein n=1 Tax=Meira miltonrushii TaxID=1280837 RepID=A0A316VG67_9BASI|nr:DUF726-domain-containing protein [Meira miltonrushii]PWN36314.1 DUF726-domain-containing protein [Meira miltonrushii]